eukprot:scaffold207657_cov27-Tisochrysis_lutea.AAC.4
MITCVLGPASESGSSASASISWAASSTTICVKWPRGTPADTKAEALRVVATTTRARHARHKERTSRPSAAAATRAGCDEQHTAGASAPVKGQAPRR